MQAVCLLFRHSLSYIRLRWMNVGSVQFAQVCIENQKKYDKMENLEYSNPPRFVWLQCWILVMLIVNLMSSSSGQGGFSLCTALTSERESDKWKRKKEAIFYGVQVNFYSLRLWEESDGIQQLHSPNYWKWNWKCNLSLMGRRVLEEVMGFNNCTNSSN